MKLRLLAIAAILMQVLDGSRLLRIICSKYGALVSSIILGIFTSFGLAPISIWPISILALGLFMMLLSTCVNKKRIFFYNLAYFTGYNFINLTWLSYVMEGFGQIPAPLAYFLILLIAIFYLALPYSLLATLAFKLANRRVAPFLICLLPLAYTLADFYVGYFLTGFPWNYLGYIAVEGPLKNYAPLIGIRGINALIYLASAALALSALRKFLFMPIAAVIFFFAVLIEGVNFTHEDKSFEVAMVQANISQEQTRDPRQFENILSTYWSMTKDEIKENKLVIWPESALPFFIQNDLGLIFDLNEVFKDQNASLVTGALTLDKDDSGYLEYNSIISLGKLDNIDDLKAYNKRNLVPFGEIIPFADILKRLAKIFTIPTESFSFGADNQEPISVFDYKFNPAICYEAIFTETIRSLDTDEISGILMVSNDSWFGPTKAPEQHLNIARMRSLELQKPMLRATNSGITAYIDRFGQVLDKADTDVEAVLNVSFTPYKGQTIYSKLKDIPVLIICILFFIFGLYGAFKKEDLLQEQINKLVRP